jgi:peroxiredoxin
LVEEACDSLIEAASERRDTVALSYAVAESLVAGAGRVLTDSTVLELIKEAGDDLREQIPELVAEAMELRRRIGKPAPEWTLQDLAGSEHSLEDFRGRVVLLDFWYRACPWCMRAMPALNELAHEHAQKKVAVIGMNTDASLADAMYVVKRLGLSYLNLRSGDEYKQYGVKGFPTLFVIDPQGRIADIHVGYSKDMKEKLGRAIRRAWGED